MIGIYKITNKLNGKSYIGQSIHCGKRLDEHCKGKLFIDEIIQQEGIENFNFEILKQVSKDELAYWEDFYIKKYNTMYPDGYNKRWNYKNKKDTIIIPLPQQNDLNNIQNIDYLLEIYKEKEWLQMNLNDWVNEWLNINFDCTLNNKSFQQKYFFLKKIEYGTEIISQKENECKWLIEHIDKESKLSNLYRKNIYTKNQQKLYTQIKNIVNNKSSNFKQDWVNDNEMFQYKTIGKIVELDVYINHINTFIELLKKLKNNYEKEIVSHFYLKEYSTNKTFKYTPVINLELRKDILKHCTVVIA